MASKLVFSNILIVTKIWCAIPSMYEKTFKHGFMYQNNNLYKKNQKIIRKIRVAWSKRGNIFNCYFTNHRCLHAWLHYHLFKEHLLFYIMGLESKHWPTDAKQRSGEKFYLTVVPHQIHLYTSSSIGQKSRISQFPNKVRKSNTEAVIQKEA